MVGVCVACSPRVLDPQINYACLWPSLTSLKTHSNLNSNQWYFNALLRDICWGEINIYFFRAEIIIIIQSHNHTLFLLLLLLFFPIDFDFDLPICFNIQFDSNCLLIFIKHFNGSFDDFPSSEVFFSSEKSWKTEKEMIGTDSDKSWANDKRWNYRKLYHHRWGNKEVIRKSFMP